MFAIPGRFLPEKGVSFPYYPPYPRQMGTQSQRTVPSRSCSFNSSLLILMTLLASSHHMASSFPGRRPLSRVVTFSHWQPCRQHNFRTCGFRGTEGTAELLFPISDLWQSQATGSETIPNSPALRSCLLVAIPSSHTRAQFQNPHMRMTC